MRDCPHCAEPIQDEAIYCMHCHRDVQPPLWTTSMRKCPYCAEWIDLENENCQHCGQHVGAVDLTESSAFIDSLLNDDFLDDLPPSSEPAKQSPFIEADSPADQAARPEPESDEPEAESESSVMAGQLSARAFWGDEAADESPDEHPTTQAGQSGLAEDEAAEAEYEPASFLERDASDFGRSLRSSLVEPDPADELDWQVEAEAELDTEAEPESEEDYDPDPQYSPEQPYDRKLAYGSLSDHEDEPDDESEAGYQGQSIYETETERRARDYAEQDPVEPEPALSPESAYELRSSVWASELEAVEELRSEAPGPREVRRRLPTGLLQGLLGLLLIGGLSYGLVALARGPAGAALAETLATDVPTDTPVPQPTATRSSAPTLPPETASAVEPTAGPSGATGECLRWDQVGLDDEGQELCVYGVIRRWFAVADVPFVAIFSEEAGTFAIVDRTTTHPVDPGDCIVARGPVEVMSRTRPNIDLNGTLELCPEEWLAEG